MKTRVNYVMYLLFYLANDIEFITGPLVEQL